MFSSMCSGPQDRNLLSWHGIICFRKYLTLSKILYLPDLWWLSYKLLFVRQALSSITLGGKPSNAWSCHLEGDVFSPLTDSVPSLRLYLRLPSPQPLTVQSAEIIQLLQAFVIFNRFQEQLLSVLSACQSSGHPLLEGEEAESIRDTNGYNPPSTYKSG